MKGLLRLSGLLTLLLLCACEQQNTRGEWKSNALSQQTAEGIEPVITIADIEPNAPTNRLSKLRPLADHLAASLDLQRHEVAVRIARSYQEVSTLMKNGEVDIYVDSSFPVLLVAETANAEVVLDSPVNRQRTYHCLIITNADSDITDLSQLPGRILALQEPYSTSGYLLPAATVIDKGMTLTYLAGPSEPPVNEIGYFYSGDEENTIAMLMQGIIHAGAIASTDWEILPPSIRNTFRVLAVSPAVPRKLLAVSPRLDTRTKQQLIDALLTITDDQRQEMADLTGWNWEFVPLDDQSHAGISAATQMIGQTRHLVAQ